jgi:hypothetical protein
MLAFQVYVSNLIAPSNLGSLALSASAEVKRQPL